jgi:hypothetical protein
MDDEDGAVAAIAAAVCEALANPVVRAEVADLLGGTTDARRRRFEELADVEIRVLPLDGDRGRG